MARVNIEDEAFSDLRIIKQLARKIRQACLKNPDVFNIDFFSQFTAMGIMAFVWRGSQREYKIIVTKEEMDKWTDAGIGEIILGNGLTIEQGENQYVLVGNEEQIENLKKHHIQRVEAGRKGGIKRAENAKLSSDRLGNPSEAQATANKTQATAWEIQAKLKRSSSEPKNGSKNREKEKNLKTRPSNKTQAGACDFQAGACDFQANSSQLQLQLQERSIKEDLAREDAENFQSEISNQAKTKDVKAPVDVSSEGLANASDRLANPSDRYNKNDTKQTTLAPANAPNKTSLVFKAYANAMKKKWNIDVPSSAKIYSQLKRFIGDVGIDNALKVAEYYPGRRNEFYIKRGHPIEFMISDYQVLNREINNGFILTHEMAKSIASDESAENVEKLENEFGVSMVPDPLLSEAGKRELEAKRKKLLNGKGSILIK